MGHLHRPEQLPLVLRLREQQFAEFGWIPLGVEAVAEEAVGEEPLPRLREGPLPQFASGAAGMARLYEELARQTPPRLQNLEERKLPLQPLQLLPKEAVDLRDRPRSEPFAAPLAYGPCPLRLRTRYQKLPQPFGTPSTPLAPRLPLALVQHLDHPLHWQEPLLHE